MPTILIVDDDPNILQALVGAVLGPSDVQIHVGRTGVEGIALANKLSPDVVILDIQLPDMSGLEVYQQFRQKNSLCPVIFVTGTSSTETAIEAMKQGAYDYLFKPVEVNQLRQVLKAALEVNRMMRTAVVPDTSIADDEADRMVGRCPLMREVYKSVGRVTGQDVTVLILGESGTGKELIARSIYQHSQRGQKPFLAINCAAIPEGLLESELFGHEKGAFTGADRRRIGKFEQCNGGTLFLDEVGDLPILTQAKLLRVLQDGSFERVGGNDTIKTNVRLIAATNRDLDAMCADGRFRPDLYYRLSVFTIRLPPLRERGEDLEELVRFYLGRFSRMLNRDVREISPEAMQILRSHHWPGNIRELQSVLKQSLLRASGQVLIPSFLPELPQASVVASGNSSIDPLISFVRQRLNEQSKNLYAEVIHEVDRLILPMVLEHTQGNQQQAAAILGIARQTLRTKLRELGISITRAVDTDSGN